MLLGRKAIGTVAYLGGLPAVLESFTWAWGQMIQYNQELWGLSDTQYIHYDRAAISDHGPARNSLVSRFMGDWLVQMDTDHVFDPDIVCRLVTLANECDIDVLSAVYQMKNPPHVPVLFHWMGGALQPVASWPSDCKVLQIGSSGGGCLFVRRRAFDALALAYQGERPFDKRGIFSEDHSFAWRCREQGIPYYAAMHIESQHLRVVPVTLADMPMDGQLSRSAPIEVGGFH